MKKLRNPTEILAYIDKLQEHNHQFGKRYDKAFNQGDVELANQLRDRAKRNEDLIQSLKWIIGEQDDLFYCNSDY